MYLGYFDESDSENKKYTVVAGILLHDRTDFDALEAVLALLIEEQVPIEGRDSFEFHASDLYNTRGPYKDIAPDKAKAILEECVERIVMVGAPIFYGVVNAENLRETSYQCCRSDSVSQTPGRGCDVANGSC